MVRDVRHSLALNSELLEAKKNYDVSFFNRVCICYVLTRRLKEDGSEASSSFLLQFCTDVTDKRYQYVQQAAASTLIYQVGLPSFIQIHYY